MVNNNQKDSSLAQWPEAAQTLMALMHAQGEVARLSEREQLFSSLLVSVNAVLWAFNWETRQVLYVSPAYERIFGRSAGLLLADYNQWRDSIYPDDLDYAERSLAEVLHKGLWKTANTGSLPPTVKCAGSATNASSIARPSQGNR